MRTIHSTVAPALWMLMDRTPPYEYLAGTIHPTNPDRTF
jgi:hypothetical protein